MGNIHGNARLTPLSRAEMIKERNQLGLSLRATAVARRLSDRTVRRWAKRAEEEGLGDRLYEHFSRPKHQPRKTPLLLEEQVCALRWQRKSYPQITQLTGVPHSTVYHILKRHGLNRMKDLLPSPPPVIRYERDSPGELVHLDMKMLGRFDKPGVRGTGSRAYRNEGAGTESLHVAIDDHSRLGFACIHKDETITSVTAALIQALSFYAQHKIRVSGIMTDNGSAHSSKAFKATCLQLGIEHLFTRPYVLNPTAKPNAHPNPLQRMGLRPPLLLQRPPQRPPPPLYQPI